MGKNELYHHGIEGQKWGKRNGPPYPLSKSESRAIKRQAKIQAKQEKIMRKRGVSAATASKYAKQMTDEQLNSIIDRLKREDTYKELVKKKEIKKSKPVISFNKEQKQPNTDPNSFKNTSKSILSSGAKTVAAAAFKKLADDMFKEEENPIYDIYRDNTGKYTFKTKTKNLDKAINLLEVELQPKKVAKEKHESTRTREKENLFNNWYEKSTIKSDKDWDIWDSQLKHEDNAFLKSITKSK